MKDESQQPDLFEDEFDQARVFRCLGGAFIGTFNRSATVPEDSTPAEEPLRQLSAMFASEKEAQAALDAGVWPTPPAQ